MSCFRRRFLLRIKQLVPIFLVILVAIGTLVQLGTSRKHIKLLKDNIIHSKEWQAQLRWNLTTAASNPSCQESPCGNLTLLLPRETACPAKHVWLGRNESLLASDEQAICAFEGSRPYAMHLPHTMQQMYKCFSFWRAHSSKTPVLVGGIAERSKFVKGFMKAMRQVFGVEWIKQLNSTTSAAVIAAPVPAYALLSADHARELSEGILNYYFHKPTLQCLLDGPRIGILNRQKSRTLLNVERLQQVLQERLDSTIPVASFEKSTFLDQVHFFSSHDIVISPHGAQLTGLAMMPACGALLELFPARYFVADYFQSLAQSSGIYHASLYLGSGNATLETATARAKRQVAPARNAMLCPPVDSIVAAVDRLFELHIDCCVQQQR